MRRELLDRTLIWNQPQLRRLLDDYVKHYDDYVKHYNAHRPHRSLGQRAPDGRTIAIAGDSGLYLVGKEGLHLRRVSIRADVGSVGPRPAWYPLTLPPAPTGCATC